MKTLTDLVKIAIDHNMIVFESNKDVDIILILEETFTHGTDKDETSFMNRTNITEDDIPSYCKGFFSIPEIDKPKTCGFSIQKFDNSMKYIWKKEKCTFPNGFDMNDLYLAISPNRENAVAFATKKDLSERIEYFTTVELNKDFQKV